MKKYLLFILVTMMYASMYAQKTRVINAKEAPGYTIYGTVEGHVNGDTVYICKLNYVYLIPEDTTIITNGKFHFKGKTDVAKLRCIVVSMNKKPIICPFVLCNEKFNIKVMKDSKFSAVSGSYNNDLWREYFNHLAEIDNKLTPKKKRAKGTPLTKAERDSLVQEEKKYHREDSIYTVKFLIDKLPSGTSDVLLDMMMPRLNKTTLQVILDKMKRVCPKDVMYMSLMQQRKVESKTAVGCNYTDIVMNDPDGKPVKLSDFVSKNKVTMIDFWASWCGPCRREMPNVIKAYNEYKDKGFAVVGVSFDNNKEAWRDAIQKLGIPWPQMSDLKAWQSAGATLYSVHGIPAAVLIDQNGKIIAKDLRGEELQTKLKEIFK